MHILPFIHGYLVEHHFLRRLLNPPLNYFNTHVKLAELNVQILSLPPVTGLCVLGRLSVLIPVPLQCMKSGSMSLLPE